MQTKRRGFTLIETVTTLFIISLLAMLIIPNVTQVREVAQKRQSEAMVQMIQGQIGLYFEGTNNTSVNYTSLINNGYLTDAQVSSAVKKNIYIKDGIVIQGKVT